MKKTNKKSTANRQAWVAPTVRSGGVKVPLERLKDYGEAEALPRPSRPGA
jgi:hypothetical protein